MFPDAHSAKTFRSHTMRHSGRSGTAWPTEDLAFSLTYGVRVKGIRRNDKTLCATGEWRAVTAVAKMVMFLRYFVQRQVSLCFILERIRVGLYIWPRSGLE